MSKIDSLMPFTIVAALWLMDVFTNHVDRIPSVVMLIVLLLLCILFDVTFSFILQQIKNIIGSETWVVVYKINGQHVKGIVLGDFKTMCNLAKAFPDAVGIYKSQGPFRRIYWFKKAGQNQDSML